MKTKINIGCGDKKLDGYVNIDLSNADLIHDVRQPLPYKDNSIQEIYAKHIIEHFSRAEWELIKKDWYRVLEPNGLLTIECPDFIRCMKRYIENSENRRDYWMLTIYGRQQNEGQYHKNGFYLEKLKKELMDEGFLIKEFYWLFDKTPDINGFNLKLMAVK